MCDTVTTVRRFGKCADCLSVVAVDVPPSIRSIDGWQCALCDGRFIDMGRVAVDARRLVQERERCACDERCTHARGPLCVCRCGGENHGTGAVVTYVVDAGPVPVVQTKPSREAQAMAAEWRAAVATVRAERDALLTLRRSRYLSGPEYSRLSKLSWLLKKAKGQTSHKGRMKTIGAALAPVAVPVLTPTPQRLRDLV